MTRSRAATNPLPLMFLRSNERLEAQRNLLRRLFAASSGHELVQDRMLSSGSNPDPLMVLRGLKPIISVDHTKLIAKRLENTSNLRIDADNGIVFSTGGTTGQPKLLLTSYEEVIHNAHVHGQGYAAGGITSEDTVATLGECGIFAAEFAVIAALSSIGSTVVPFVDISRIEANSKIMVQLGVSAMVVMPSELQDYIDLWEQSAHLTPPIRHVTYGGEPITSDIIERWRAVLGSSLSVSGTFQSADAGTIGFQCRDCEIDTFHTHDDLQFVEILDEKNQPTNGEGHLVVTNMYRYRVPVIRMLTGDKAVWLKGLCRCGRRSPKFRYLGRHQ